MGVVYKARQKSLNRFVALKLLAPERAGDPQFAARFEKEARALAALNHPNIVTIYDHGQAGGFYYLLMEFVDGVTVRQLLAKERVAPREALAIVPQICDALQFAHDQGIIHRDIKPENILMDRRGRVKVADFGLAKIIGNQAGDKSPLDEPAGATAGLTDTGKVMGTPQYMSPEQIQAPGDVDHRADIYALGVVFYQMLPGELPGKKIEPPSKKVQIDVRLDEVVLRALEQKPELRYQQASILKTQIETIASSSGDVRPEASRVQRGVPVLRWRDRWIWDTSNVTLMAFVPIMVSLLLILPLAIFLRTKHPQVWMWLPGGLGLLFAAINGLVGWRVRRLKARLPKSDAEVAEAMVFERPKEAPGIAVLHDDRLELIGIAVIDRLVIRLDEIASISEVRWFNGKRLWWKHGFVLDLKNGRRIGVAVPEAFGRRWRAKLSGGTLPELPDGETEKSVSQINVASDAALLRVGSWIAYGTALFTIVFGLLKLTKFDFVPAQLFFGVVVVVTLSLVMLIAGVLMELKAQSESKKTCSDQPEAPRMSRTTIVGASLVGLAMFAALLIGKLYGTPAKTWAAMSPLEKTGFDFADAVVLTGCAVPFVATILGWIAVAQIRRSAGKLYGLWLAVFNGLLFPLLALDALILVAWYFLCDSVWPHPGGFEGIDTTAKLWVAVTALTAISCCVVDYLIIRRVWRAMNRPVASPAPPRPKFSHFWSWLAVNIAVLMIVAIVVLNFVKRPQTQPVAVQSLSFGPVVERSLPFEEDTALPACLDFESGKIVWPPAQMNLLDHAAVGRWLRDNSVDASAEELTTGPRLVSYDYGCYYKEVESQRGLLPQFGQCLPQALGAAGLGTVATPSASSPPDGQAPTF